ncbi:hypothetical protein ACET3Z_004510 [Daucus carota]
MATLPQKLYYLGLSSCKMKEFPHISENVEYFVYLDLSNNQIEGEIPRWIGTTDWLLFPYVNLSHNHLTGGLEHLPWNTIWHLDLQSNMLNGSLPRKPKWYAGIIARELGLKIRRVEIKWR